MRLKLSFLASGLALLLPGLAQPAAFSVNGTCWAGNCASPDVLSVGGSTGSSFASNYTFANGDMFSVSGNYGSSYSADNGVSIFGNPTATYLGNKSSSGASSQADVLTFNFLQNFNFTTGSPDGYYFYYFISDTSGPIASDSTYTADVTYNGQHIGATTVGTGFSGTNGFNQAFLTPGTTDPLAVNEILTLSFGAGSGVGATIATVTPEPGSLLLLSIGGLGLLGTYMLTARRTAAAQRKAQSR